MMGNTREDLYLFHDPFMLRTAELRCLECAGELRKTIFKATAYLAVIYNCDHCKVSYGVPE